MIPENRPTPRGAARFSFITLGCKSNQYDSAAMAADLRRAGLTDTEPARADVIVINTCMVTGPAQSQCRKAIRQARRENPGARLVVSGCMTRGAFPEVAGLREVDLVLDPAARGSLAEALGLGQRASAPVWSDWPEDPAVTAHSRDRAFLKIQDGCDSSCSYCVVPSVRGRARSLEPDRVCDAVRKLMGSGSGEVVLTGIHLGQYGRGLDSSQTLEGLLLRLAGAGLPGRIRLSSLEPHEITDGLLRLIRESGGFICRHIHLTVQSGSGRVLKRMNRPYTEEDLRESLARIRDALPGAGLGCDAICGFPGETEEDFALTGKILSDFSIPFVHAFPYSPRPGTPAARLKDDVPHGEKKDRVRHLRSLAARNRRAFAREQEGKTLQAAVEAASGGEGVLTGLADNYLRVRIRGGEGIRPGELVSVRIDSAAGDALRARPAAGEGADPLCGKPAPPKETA